MALNGLQIQKLLPKTNCKECGSNTCLAFAMKLAAKTADLSECPYASDEAKEVLGAASEPPVKAVVLGNEITAKVGEETVLYRHEKTFVNQTLIAINIDDTCPEAEKTLNQIRDYKLERVGEILAVDAVAITQKGTDTAAYVAAAKKAYEITKLPIIFRGTDAAVIEAAKALKDTHSVISGVTKANADEMRKVAEENGHILAIYGDKIDDIVEVTGKVKEAGFNNLLLQFHATTLAHSLQLNTIARRAAIKDGNKALGYGSLKFVDTDCLLTSTANAVTEICKYGGICVLPCFDPAQLVTIMALRLNIFTDPQKPIQVEPKVYPIGEPDRNSPVFLTTNFSLTYFLVSGEIENTGISAWLVIPECEGFSVLTAWSAGKFSGASIGKFCKEIGLDDMVDTREITIPGYVSQISGELEESMPGWKVSVGTQEASDIEGYIKTKFKDKM